MDIGVGSFVFAQGLAAASPLLRNPHSVYVNPMNKLGSATRKVVPLFILAGARIIAVKGMAYPVRCSFPMPLFLDTVD
jgi:phosphatidylinositol glycan class W